MTFDYAAVARESLILSQHAVTSGNYDLIAGDVLKRVGPQASTYQDPETDRTYYVLHGDDGLNFLVVCGPEISIDDAYLFLSRLQRSFLSRPCASSWRSASGYGLQNEFSEQIRELMAHIGDWASADRIQVDQWEEDQTTPLVDLKSEDAPVFDLCSLLYRRSFAIIGLVAIILFIVLLIIAVK
jgi:hypothetical protein